MKIAVFGAGYVGCVTAACLADLRNRVWLVETASEKLAQLHAGGCPVTEPGLAELLCTQLGDGRVTPTGSCAEAVQQSDLALVCVGTPAKPDGAANVETVMSVCNEIAACVAEGADPYHVVIRSTLPARDIEGTVIPSISSVLREELGTRITLATNPEFLREGNSIHDFMAPPFVVVGSSHCLAVDALRDLYSPIDAPFHSMSIGSASLLKYACNAYHAAKVVFANEIAALETAFHADADEVMEVFSQDVRLNISAAYLRPGFTFGGSCLPKDLRALTREGRANSLELPLLTSVLTSNEMLLERSIAWIESFGARRVALVGLSFKVGTDDLRESPMVVIAERLDAAGCELKAYDPDVQPASLLGQNLDYASDHLKKLGSMLCRDAEEALWDREIVVYAKPVLDAEKLAAVCLPDALVLDLTRELPQRGGPLNVLRLGASASETAPSRGES